MFYAYMENMPNGEISTKSVDISVNNYIKLKSFEILVIHTISDG
jgi:hypothetical protein